MTAITIYFDVGDPNNLGWAYRGIEVSGPLDSLMAVRWCDATQEGGPSPQGSFDALLDELPEHSALELIPAEGHTAIVIGSDGDYPGQN